MISIKDGKEPTRVRIRTRLYNWKRSKYIHLFPVVSPDPYKTAEDLVRADEANFEESNMIATVVVEEVFKWFDDARKEVTIKHITLPEGTPWTENSLPIGGGNAGGIVWEIPT